ncbi:MAG: hypothetical protein JST49_06135 [Bacteroidetes bacterium]|nr:hypothetical protein [Bacteroidota bacterium]
MQPYHIDSILDYIIGSQQPNGGFPTYEYFPVWKPQDGWTLLPDSSPFVTANLLYCLLELNDARLEPVLEHGCKYLQNSTEYGGYVRFWPKDSLQHPVPLDIDDTAVSSYILQQCGKSIDNKKALLACTNSKGYLFTWLQPTAGMWFTNPKAAASFTLGCLQGFPTRYLKHYYYSDTEPGVAANALLYLTENKGTQRCVDAIIEEVLRHNFNMKFYEDELVVYYHIARAYKHSVPAFAVLNETIIWRIQKRFENGIGNVSELWRSMAANVLLDFKADIALANALVDSVASSEMYPDKWQPMPYFCSRDRNFLSGSPQYTAAVFAEAATKLIRAKQEGSHA